MAVQDDEDGNLIDMAFAKKRVEDRKEWLRAFTKGTHVDYKVRPPPHGLHLSRGGVTLTWTMTPRPGAVTCVCVPATRCQA